MSLRRLDDSVRMLHLALGGEIHDLEILNSILAAAYQASFKTEEGVPTRVSLAYALPGERGNPLRFLKEEDLSSIPKLAPLVDPQFCLGVWSYGRAKIWGIDEPLPSEPIFKIVRPAFLTVQRYETNVAILSNQNLTILENQHEAFIRLAPLRGDHIKYLKQLLRSMLSRQKGGTVIILPDMEYAWDKPLASIRKIKWLAGSSKKRRLGQPRFFGNAPDGVIDQAVTNQLVNLTTVDGATIFNHEFDLIGFGAMISSLAHDDVQVHLFSPEDTDHITPVQITSIEQLGGARHRSAATYCLMVPGATAYVVSQDGRLTTLSSKDKTIEAVMDQHLLFT